MNRWNWMTASGADVPAMVAMAELHFQQEIDDIFRPEPVAYARNLTHAVVNGFYAPGTELVLVARDASSAMLAYTWVRQEAAPWSDDAMALVRMAHVDLSVPPRLRVRLVREMLVEWESWAQSAGLKIICSTTMRRDQAAFLRLHETAGYDVRGSYAYKRLPSRDSLQS